LPAATKASIESYEIPETGAASPQSGIPSDANSNAVDSTAVFSPVYESDPLDPPEIAVQEKKIGNVPKGATSEFKVYLNLHSDLPHVIEQLQYLLTQLAPDRLIS